MHVRSDRLPSWPVPSVETVDLLLDRGVRCLGTDGASMGAAEDGEPVHVRGLSQGMVFVEVLTNLRLLPERGAFFLFLPLKIEHGTGAPGRALGFLRA